MRIGMNVMDQIISTTTDIKQLERMKADYESRIYWNEQQFKQMDLIRVMLLSHLKYHLGENVSKQYIYDQVRMKRYKLAAEEHLGMVYEIRKRIDQLKLRKAA